MHQQSEHVDHTCRDHVSDGVGGTGVRYQAHKIASVLGIHPDTIIAILITGQPLHHLFVTRSKNQ